MKKINILFAVLVSSILSSCGGTTSSTTSDPSTTISEQPSSEVSGGETSKPSTPISTSVDTNPIVSPNPNYEIAGAYNGDHWKGLTFNEGESISAKETKIYNYMRQAQGSYKKAFKQISYSTVTDFIREADRDPKNSKNVISLYDFNSLSTGPVGSGVKGWNREHTYPVSKLGEKPAAGPNSATDAANLFAADSELNEKKSNHSYANINLEEKYEKYTVYNSFGTRTDNFVYQGNFAPTPHARGEIARAQLYMMAMWPSNASKTANGNIGTFIKWDREYPPTVERDLQRNAALEKYQQVRNPFIDHRELGCTIWGDYSFATQLACGLA